MSPRTLYEPAGRYPCRQSMAAVRGGHSVVPVRVLTIAGSDSGGGAGIQADLKTFLAHGVHGMSAVTAVTVQNSVGVQGFYELEPRAVFEQIESVVTDIGVDAAKTGMLASAPIVEAVADACERFAIANLVVKGGHLRGDEAVDLLWDGREARWLEAPRLATPHTHGTGCTLASALAANLASGLDVPTATRAAKQYLSGALAGGFPLGKGVGPTDHAWRFRAAGLLRPGGPSHPGRHGWPYAAGPYEG